MKTRTRMKARTRLLGCVLGAAVLALPACGNPTDAASGEGNAINLVMSNHPWQRGIEPLIDRFEEESGVTVNVQTFAEQQTRDKIQLNLQSRSAAMDVYMTLPSREGPLFASSGYYEPLDDRLAQAPAEYEADGFSRGALTGMQVDGTTYALPVNVEGPVLYYRTDLFEQWGLTPPTTADELRATAEAVKGRTADVTPITLRGASSALPFTFGPFLHGTGLEWTDAQGAPTFDDPRAARAIDQYATLAREFGPPGVINYSFTESSTLFAQGKAAMELESSNELNSLIDPGSSTVAENVGVAAVPATTVLSWGIAMSPFSENKDAAWQFMQWATSPGTQLELAKADIAPPRQSVADEPAYTEALDTPTHQQWRAAVADLQENGNVEVGPVGANAPAMRKVIGDAVGKAILGEASPEQAAAEIQSGLTSQLADG